MSDLLVTDTHALLWHLTGAGRKLGRAARRCFERAETGRTVLLVPVTVLVEVLEGVGRGRLRPAGGFGAWVERLRAHPGYRVVDLTAETVLRAAELMAVPDRADRLIAATALEHGVPLITRDPALRDVGVETVW